ncbi:ROK family transcriptional regulator [Lacrimispora brassicae]
MKAFTGTSIKGLKNKNRTLILKLVATCSPISRVEIAKETGLTKMTVGNLVNELIERGFITECDTSPETVSVPGRKPSMLRISDHSPCICGMLIKRGLCQVILADLSGTIISQSERKYQHSIDAGWLVDTLMDLFLNLKHGFTREILAIGISSIGPLNSHTGTILKPPFFYHIENLPLTSIISEKTGLPCFLINDANAGALAEKLYGLGKKNPDFAYLHIMNGIGAGFVLDNKLFDGHRGQSGEIGHTSINFSGPRCACGNVGCLELYANLDQMQRRIRSMCSYFPGSSLAAAPESATWDAIIREAGKRDPLALAAMEEFCDYISYAMIDALNLLDLSTVIVGYDAPDNSWPVERFLCDKLSNAVIAAPYRELHILHSCFNGNAPLIGAIAVAAEQIFSFNLPVFEPEQNENEPCG